VPAVFWLAKAGTAGTSSLSLVELEIALHHYVCCSYGHQDV